MADKKRQTKKQKNDLIETPPKRVTQAFERAHRAIVAATDAAHEWGHTSDTIAALGHLAGVLQDEVDDAKRVQIACLHDELDFLRSRMNDLEKGRDTAKR